MRKLGASELVTLDGVLQAFSGADEGRSVGFVQGGWLVPYADNSMESYQPAEQLDQYYSITVFMEMDLIDFGFQIR